MPSARLTPCWPGKTTGAPGHQALQLGKGDDRTGEGDGADRHAKGHFDEAGGVDMPGLGDAERRRRMERRGGDENRRQADERMECGDELRHGGHRDPPRRHRAHAAAKDEPQDDEAPGEAGSRRRSDERGRYRDRHAGHAEKIPAPGRLGVR